MCVAVMKLVWSVRNSSARERRTWSSNFQGEALSVYCRKARRRVARDGPCGPRRTRIAWSYLYAQIDFAMRLKRYYTQYTQVFSASIRVFIQIHDSASMGVLLCFRKKTKISDVPITPKFHALCPENVLIYLERR